jgi:hypothetical protein
VEVSGVAAGAMEESGAAAGAVEVPGGAVEEVVEVPDAAQGPGVPPCRTSRGGLIVDSAGSALGHGSVPPSDPLRGS